MELSSVVYVITRSDVVGGASAHVLDLAEAVQSKGHRVAIVVGGSGVVADIARSRGLQCLCVPELVRDISISEDIRCIFVLRALLQKLKPDLVHLHSAKAGILGRIAAKSLGLRCVYTAHGWPFTEGISVGKRKLYRIIEKFMAYLSDEVIAVSDYDRRIALDAGVVKDKKLTVVHNGVKNCAYDPCNENLAFLPVRLVMVARFEEPKDQEQVISALQKLKHLHWTMEFIGDGPGRVNAEEKVRSLGLVDKIVFSGARDDVPQRLAQADAFVLASRWEGFPLVILEAMRAELPVVASDVGGVSESVKHGVTGILVPRGDQESMAVALELLITQPDRRKAMGLRGRAEFEKNFTLEAMLEKTLKVYQRALQ
ncbi:MAG: glycosyltransferase family 4 protein [Gammaproteobacteria bacterium]|nr:glycosyltransferase family 4 protein [Gammaproteobacteria bacterium]